MTTTQPRSWITGRICEDLDVSATTDRTVSVGVYQLAPEDALHLSRALLAAVSIIEVLESREPDAPTPPPADLREILDTLDSRLRAAIHDLSPAERDEVRQVAVRTALDRASMLRMLGTE